MAHSSRSFLFLNLLLAGLRLWWSMVLHGAPW